MMQSMKKITHSAKETIGLGESLGRWLGGGEVVCLYGELGSGKTTFTQGLAKGLGIKRRILSPTFIIVRHYPINRKLLKTFYHVDLYRIEKTKDSVDLGLNDWFYHKSNILVIEWPQRLGRLLPQKRIDIYFNYISENEREITINKS